MHIIIYNNIIHSNHEPEITKPRVRLYVVRDIELDLIGDAILVFDLGVITIEIKQNRWRSALVCSGVHKGGFRGSTPPEMYGWYGR